MSINRVIISGNLTRDPDLRRTQSGMEILTIGVAVNDRRKNASTGEWEDYANYIDVSVFGKRASSLSGILTKGMHVVIDGKLRQSRWEKDGQKHNKIEVIADDVELPPRASQSRSNGNNQQSAEEYVFTPQQKQQTSYNDPASSLYDDEIPF